MSLGDAGISIPSGAAARPPSSAASEILRYGVSAVVVLAVFGGIAIAVLRDGEGAEAAASDSAVILDLEPAPTPASAPPNDAAAGPPQDAVEEQAQMQASPAPTPPEPLQPDVPPAVAPAAAILKPEDHPVEQQTQAQDAAEAQPEMQPEASSTPQVSVVSPPSESAGPSPRAISRWQQSLMVQLEHAKRYPAQARGLTGDVAVAFTIDRHGHLLSSAIVHGSGSPILDAETLALIKRSQPFPAPPADLAESKLSFVVPIHYAARRL